MNTGKRILSLDILRGITVAGMILVNNPGTGEVFVPLEHAAWNGLTPCDLIFPFFLCIMGMSTYLSLHKYNFKADRHVVYKICKRSLLILLVCWSIDWFYLACEGDFFPVDKLRLTGVLTRIGICYFFTSMIALRIRHKYIPYIVAILLIFYGFVLLLGNGYAQADTNIIKIIDQSLLGSKHLYNGAIVDPEGVLSTIPSIAHTLIGFCLGRVMVEVSDTTRKVGQLLKTGFLLLSAGWLLSFVLPLNKHIWSPSFVLVTCGAASSLLGVFMYFIDIKGKGRWCTFFRVYGVNPLFLYVLSEVGSIIFIFTETKESIIEFLSLLFTNPYILSAAYATFYMLLIGLAGYVLYKKQIFIKL